jgi:hypothetical protein
MFKNSYQSGFLSILYSIGSKPLKIWDKEGGFALCCHRPAHTCVTLVKQPPSLSLSHSPDLSPAPRPSYPQSPNQSATATSSG